MKKRDINHNFLGKRYRIKHVPTKKLQDPGWTQDCEEICLGKCEDPKTKNKSVYIDDSLSGKELIRVYLHEFLHCLSYEMFDEDFVDKASKDLSGALWRLGYRLKEDLENNEKEKKDYSK